LPQAKQGFGVGVSDAFFAHAARRTAADGRSWTYGAATDNDLFAGRTCIGWDGSLIGGVQTLASWVGQAHQPAGTPATRRAWLGVTKHPIDINRKAAKLLGFLLYSSMTCLLATCAASVARGCTR
jgi:hypothetical protein